jgi:hypothetical protein
VRFGFAAPLERRDGCDVSGTYKAPSFPEDIGEPDSGSSSGSESSGEPGGVFYIRQTQEGALRRTSSPDLTLRAYDPGVVAPVKGRVHWKAEPAAAAATADEFITATIPELPDILEPSVKSWLEIHDPEVSPSSRRLLLALVANQVTVVANRAKMKALPGIPYRRVIFLTAPEAGVARSYTYVHGDTTPPNDFSIIAADDGLGTYFEYLLA